MSQLAESRAIAVRGAAGPTIQNKLVAALNADGATIYYGDSVIDTPTQKGVGPVTREGLMEALGESKNQGFNQALVFYRFTGSTRPFPKTSRVCREHGLSFSFYDPANTNPRQELFKRTFILTETDSEADLASGNNPFRRSGKTNVLNRSELEVSHWLNQPIERLDSVSKAIAEARVQRNRVALIEAAKQKLSNLSDQALEIIIKS